jgi:integrase
MSQPIRRPVEPGIKERINAAGERLGYEISFKDANGKSKRQTVAGGLQEARDALANARTRRVKQEREPDDPRMSFNAVVDEFERVHVPGLRKTTRDTYAAGLRRLRAEFGSKRITSITKTDLRVYINSEVAEGLKSSTVGSHLANLNLVYAFARDDLGIPVTMPKLKRSELPDGEDAREHRILTDAEVARVLDALPPHRRLYFRFLAETGCRRSEGLGLTARRINGTQVTISEQLSRVGAVLVPLKTSTSKRTIEISRSLAAALLLSGGTERVFEHLNRSSTDRAWREAVAGLDDPKPVIHDLRHTHVSRLIGENWNPQDVAGRIGDTLQTTLSVYAHEFDTQRSSERRQARIEALYGAEMATPDAISPANTDEHPIGEVVDLQAKRSQS